MAKVYISADLEGVNGVYSEHQVIPSENDAYKKAVDQLILEVNAVIDGLSQCGIKDITVNDAHTGQKNISKSRLPEFIKLTSGSPRPISMMYGLDDTYDCIFYVGYHGKVTTPNAALAHTFNMKFSDVRINDITIGEIELNSIFAGLLGISVAFACGDDVFCTQTHKDIGAITTVTTKKSVSFSEIVPRDNEELLSEIRQKTSYAIQNKDSWVKYIVESPYKMNIAFKNSENVHLFGDLPLIKQISENEIEFSSNDYCEMYKTLQFISAVSK